LSGPSVSDVRQFWTTVASVLETQRVAHLREAHTLGAAVDH